MKSQLIEKIQLNQRQSKVRETREDINASLIPRQFEIEEDEDQPFLRSSPPRASMTCPISSRASKASTTTVARAPPTASSRPQ